MSESRLVCTESDTLATALTQCEEQVNRYLASPDGWDFAIGTGYAVKVFYTDGLTCWPRFLVSATLIRERTESDNKKPTRLTDVF